MGLVLSNNTALASAADTTFPPRILANSVLRASEATVTASATTSGGEHENAWKEGFTHDFWKPGASGINWLRASLTSSVVCNAVGIAAHNLHQVGGTVKMQHSTDGGTSWSDSSSAYTPGTSQPLLIQYADTEAADHRLHIDSTGEPIIGVVVFGAVLKMRVGVSAPWDPPYLGRDNRYVNDRSEGGAFIGRTLIARGAELRLGLENVPMGWIRDVWDPVVRTLEQYGFFFAARDLKALGGVAEAEVLYGWVTRQPEARYDNPMYGSIDLRAKGIID